MKKILMIFLLSPILLRAQEVKNIGQLFDSLKSQPVSLQDEFRVQQALTGKQLAYSKLYPKVDLFGRYDHSSKAAAMLPLPLNDLFAYKADETRAQPFSENIFRIGTSISMPVLVASIFPMAAKAKKLVQSAEDQKYINLLKNEAIIVGANANLTYLQALNKALEKKKSSLSKTLEFVHIKVNNGRAPESSLLKINDGLHQIDILKNELAIQQEGVISVIKSLTGISLEKPINIEQVGTYQAGVIKSLDPLRKKVDANKLNYRAEKEKLLPSLMLQANYTNSFAKSYNNNQNINKDYTTAGLVLKVPLFAKDQYAHIKKSKLDFESSQNDLQKMSIELEAQAEELQKSLLLIESSIQLYKQSVEDKDQLLAIAKVSYKTDEISMEDYLKYEDDLILEKSKLFKAKAQKWQTLMKLSVIYGNNIEEIVK
ncbi:TolC family protein [Ancylomarina longa]|uniref:TolC family protein n=1 Tax=Ancylomarina longa TaxID=2487017 RepID=A0A434AGV8_9BACT|nr:TolC family protein [Ancylomarina longa]RUT73610.1 hypothetical protein DLK05_12340 [Ancylomarina longa]